ncbi:DUF2063 domain-containing protein [Shewanella colwelliana]|uniref:DUF2063 domain-containing protein n=1 Tax=Shewanella colwelliana TaxID=23 RepID=A0A1E5INU3_SHECO|nr:putative DNA-binding domain-containing protein [Shewanella colwelliana]MDX1280301.1 putative DNA-binding domain-containing protein [Shewanella colwelliana]OEG72146.1 DUF2063 domain-containing protein [Shewanella colwelliana]GIU25248.1 DUF2063 domain-containing protein [Shewanella colwelliana]GIU45667.1 DUF2063 domain-containing protein [Shewanella colwelliana]
MTFVNVQQSFIDYIRDPSQPLPSGTDARRMQVYRELFFNNINGFVSNAFPVLCSLYEDKQWEELVQQFFVTHDCQTPIFIEIAQEFLVFLQQEYPVSERDPVFMLELAHYEWLELVVATEQENPLHHPIDDTQVSSAKLAFRASARVAQYHFDVQRISAEYQPLTQSEQPSFFCIYRDAEEEVCFLQLNPLAAQVLAYIEQHDYLEFDQIIKWLCGLYTQMDKETLVSGCTQMLGDMISRNIILGHR